jgi:hypothetical protein
VCWCTGKDGRETPPPYGKTLAELLAERVKKNPFCGKAGISVSENELPISFGSLGTEMFTVKKEASKPSSCPICATMTRIFRERNKQKKQATREAIEEKKKALPSKPPSRETPTQAVPVGSETNLHPQSTTFEIVTIMGVKMTLDIPHGTTVEVVEDNEGHTSIRLRNTATGETAAFVAMKLSTCSP